jgi:phage shock protein PspC (stress-responsive transcriptional regulator)
MALNLDKNSAEKKYYYSENGNTLGPFSIIQILEKINGDTLIYRDGIEWTAANNLSELKKFFPKEKIVEKVVIKENIVKINTPTQNNMNTQRIEIQSSLYRSKDSKILSGFCGGLAHKFNISVLFIRALLIFSFFFYIGWFYFFSFLLPAFKTKDI